jgi:hypothetical protein
MPESGPKKSSSGPRSVLVYVACVSGVTVRVVHVVDVIGVRDGDVAAALAVRVIVASVFGVLTELALIDVAVVDLARSPRPRGHRQRRARNVRAAARDRVRPPQAR